MNEIMATWAILMDACRACPEDARVLMLGVAALAIAGPWVVAGVLGAVNKP